MASDSGERSVGYLSLETLRRRLFELCLNMSTWRRIRSVMESEWIELKRGIDAESSPTRLFRTFFLKDWLRFPFFYNIYHQISSYEAFVFMEICHCFVEHNKLGLPSSTPAFRCTGFPSCIPAAPWQDFDNLFLSSLFFFAGTCTTLFPSILSPKREVQSHFKGLKWV